VRLDFATGEGSAVAMQRYREVHGRYWYGK
jgi:hypothetical protein